MIEDDVIDRLEHCELGRFAAGRKVQSVLAVGKQLGGFQADRAAAGAHAQGQRVAAKDRVAVEAHRVDDLVEASAEAAQFAVDRFAFKRVAADAFAGAAKVEHGLQVALEPVEAFDGSSDEPKRGFSVLGCEILCFACFGLGLADTCFALACEGERVVEVVDLVGSEPLHGIGIISYTVEFA